jgi:pyridoxine 5-phosphate synthase
MSYLNPANISTDLGVGLDPLRRMRSTVAADAGPDRVAFALDAQGAGADAVLISLAEPWSEADVTEFAQLVASVMIGVDLAIPPNDASIEFACRFLPRSVKIVSGIGALDRHERLVQDAAFAPVRQLLSQLHGTRSKVVVALPASLEAVAAAQSEGVTIIELDARPFAMAVSPEAASRALTALHQAATAALRCGLEVHAAGGVGYRTIGTLAALGVFSQINCGHAIAVHALKVGWTRAVADMKALTVPALAGDFSP